MPLGLPRPEKAPAGGESQETCPMSYGNAFASKAVVGFLPFIRGFF